MKRCILLLAICSLLSPKATLVATQNSTQSTTTPSATVTAANNSTVFELYVPGLYGIACYNRIWAYQEDTGDYDSISYADMTCACSGVCPPPLKPNPAAATWWQNNLNAQRAAAVYAALVTNAPYLAFTIAIVAIGLSGNLLAFFSIVIWLPRNVTNICLASQCIADMLVVSFGPILRMVNLITMNWYSGAVGCSLVYAIRDLTFVASSMTLALLGVERFIAICYPLKAKSVSSPSKTYKLLAIIWTIAFGLGVWRSFNVVYSSAANICLAVPSSSRQVAAFFSVRWLGVFALPLLVLVFCYSRVCMTLYASLAQVRKLKNSGSLEAASKNKVSKIAEEVPDAKKKEESEKEEREVNGRIKVIRLLMTCVTMFFICWGPVVTTETYIGIGGNTSGINITMLNIFYLMSYLNSMLNPILYGFFSLPIRICYQRVLLCYVCRGKKLDLPGESTQASKGTRGFNSQVTSDASKATSVTYANEG